MFSFHGHKKKAGSWTFLNFGTFRVPSTIITWVGSHLTFALVCSRAEIKLHMPFVTSAKDPANRVWVQVKSPSSIFSETKNMLMPTKMILLLLLFLFPLHFLLSFNHFVLYITSWQSPHFLTQIWENLWQSPFEKLLSL